MTSINLVDDITADDLPAGGFDPSIGDHGTMAPAARPRPLLGQITLRSFTIPWESDRIFRRCLADGDYPVVPDAVRAASTAEGRIRDLSHAVGAITVESTNAIVQRTVASLASGEPVDPAEYLRDLEVAHVRETVALTQQNIDRTMLDTLERHWRTVLRAAQPEMLAGLGQQLTDLMNELHEADDLLGNLDVSDPIAVARADEDQRRGLRMMSDLSSVYPRIRIAQQALMAAAGQDNPARDLDSDEWTFEPDKPTWADVFGSGVHAFADVPAAGYTTAGLEGLTLMRVLAQRDDAWMPTYEQITDAWARLNPDTRRAARQAAAPDRTTDA